MTFQALAWFGKYGFFPDDVKKKLTWFGKSGVFPDEL